MNLSRHFTLQALTRSGTATRLGLSNAPDATILANLQRLAADLELIRELAGGLALRINSGYRSPEVNAAVGGSPTSYHMLGLAADFDPPPGLSHDELQHRIAASTLDFDLVMEEGTVTPEAEGGSRWIHFQKPKPGAIGRHLVLDATVTRLGGTIGRIAVD